jgi:AraC-like DNA-binding protein
VPRGTHVPPKPTRQPQQPEFFSLQIAEARRFCLDLDPSPRERLTVVCGGCEHCAPDYEIHRKTFPYWSIEFVAQGQGRLALDGELSDLAAATFFSYGPGIAQDIVSDPKAPLVKYFVDFAGREAAALLRRYGPKPGQVVQTSAPSAALALFDDLIATALRATPLSARLSAVLLEQLILTIAETSIPLGAADTQAFATYRRCRKHIEDHWSRLETLEQAADESHVDPAYLCRLFRRFDRQSPYQYLLRLKMNHAAEQLLDPAASVKEVADDLRFSDAFHFSRVFKKVMGLSPARFARLHHRS